MKDLRLTRNVMQNYSGEADQRKFSEVACRGDCRTAEKASSMLTLFQSLPKQLSQGNLFAISSACFASHEFVPSPQREGSSLR
mmetsp:Transcript_12880/g.36314  ORF Transcript_12880/g.36314 Transcript_12880/m.36314 type:complete len:83 (+) Transcript_12880:2184-2432(+)